MPPKNDPTPVVVTDDVIARAIESLTVLVHDAAEATSNTPAILALVAARDTMQSSEHVAAFAPAIAALDKEIETARGSLLAESRATLLATYGDTLRAIVAYLSPVVVPTAVAPKRGRPAGAAGAASVVNGPFVVADGTEYVKRQPSRETYAPENADACGECKICDQHENVTAHIALANLRQNMTQAVKSMTREQITAHEPCIAALNIAILNAYPQAVTVTTYAPLAA